MLYTAMRVWNKDSWHRRSAKTLDASFVWLWPEHHRHCDWPVVWPSEIMCACWWRTLWTRALKWMFIYMIHQNVFLNCQCNLMHVGLTAIMQSTLKAKIVTLIRWTRFTSSRMPFIIKSNSENYIKILWFLTKWRIKIRSLLFVANGV